MLLLQGDDAPNVNPAANLSLLKKSLRANSRATERVRPGFNHAPQATKDLAGFEAPLAPGTLTGMCSWLQAQQ